MKLLAISLLALSLAACASPRGTATTGNLTAMDAKHDGGLRFAEHPMDKYYEEQSHRMVAEDAGRVQYHIGAGKWIPISSYQTWLDIGAPGMLALGTGTISGGHAVQDARYSRYAHYKPGGPIVKCGIGPPTSSYWKNGERQPWERWGPEGVESGH